MATHVSSSTAARTRMLLAACAIVSLVLLAISSAAGAVTFTVNDTGDAALANPSSSPEGLMFLKAPWAAL